MIDITRLKQSITRTVIFIVFVAFGSRVAGLRRPSLNSEQARVLWENHKNLSSVNKLLTSYPNDPRYLFAEAEAYHALGNPHAEAETWKLYMETAPFPKEACPALPHAYEKIGDQARATEAYARCYALDPTSADLAFYYAQQRMRLGETHEAAMMFLAIIATSPDYIDAQVSLAMLRFQGGQWAEAESRIDRVLKINPDYADALLVKALVLEQRNDTKNAREILGRAIRKSPDYTDLHRTLLRLCKADHDETCVRQEQAALP